jgi:hypothetical protein
MALRMTKVEIVQQWFAKLTCGEWCIPGHAIDLLAQLSAAPDAMEAQSASANMPSTLLLARVANEYVDCHRNDSLQQAFISGVRWAQEQCTLA